MGLVVAVTPYVCAQSASAPVDMSANGPVVVSGVVPDESTRQTILSRVREVYGTQRVVDKLGVGTSNAPANWAENVKKLVTPDLKSIRRGQLKVNGNVVELNGETDSPEVSEKIVVGIKASLNPTYTVRNNLQAGAPQVRVDSILMGKVIEFETSSPLLTAKGIQVLEELLPVLGGLKGRKIQVIGHTDATGLREANVRLSQNRAIAVKRYLVNKGLVEADIFTEGKGSDEPIDLSNTPEGQAKNRRIEFKVMQ